MWDNADMLNGCANALYALAAAALIYAGVHVAKHSPLLPLRHLELQGDLTHVTREQAQGAARVGAAGTFFSVDLDAVRRAFESLPWVRKVEVRRLWPDRIKVSIEEHVALARWGKEAEGQLVNSYGELFAGRIEAQRGAELPQFAGPAGTHQEVARRYALFRDLLAPLSLEPRAVALSQRLSWQLRLSNGLAVQLGRDSERDSVRERLARFVEVYPRTLGRLSRRFDYVDLRYPNGFALRVPEILRTEPRKPTRGKA